MIEAAIADVIGPAIAADEPNALLDQRIGHARELARLGGVDARELLLQRGNARALGEAAATEPDHQRPLAADLLELVKRAEHPRREALGWAGGKADRAPAVIDDHGLVPSRLGVTPPGVPALGHRPRAAVRDEVLIDEQHLWRVAIGVEHRLGERDLHPQRINAVSERAEARSQRPQMREAL